MKRKGSRLSAPKAAAGKSGTAGRVLIADDDEYVQESLSRQLRVAGYACTSVGDGAAAIEALREGSFDVALIDLEMPGRDGFEVLAAMQRDCPDTIPMVLTGTGDIPRTVRAMRLGAVDFLEKPCNPELLRNVLLRACEYRRTRQNAKQMEAVASQWQATFDASPDLLIVMDLDGRIVRCNRAAALRAKAAPAELIGKHCHDALCASAHTLSECPLGRTAAGSSDESFDHPLWGGFYEVSCAPLRDDNGRVWGRLVVARDVTERRRTQEALRKSETLNRSLVAHLPHRIFVKDRNSVYVTCNANYARDMMVTPEEIVGKDDFAFHPRDLAEKYRADDREVMDADAMRDIEELYQVGGEERWVHTVKVPYRDDQGAVIGVLGIFEDVTEHKKARETLRSSEEKFRQIVDNIGLGVALIGTDMRVLELNRQMREWFPGAKPEQRPLCYAVFSHPPRETPCELCPAAKTLRDGQVHEVAATGRRDEGVHNYRIVTAPIHDRDGQVVAMIAVKEDITEKVRIEQELQQAQKLEAIGRLAAGIAHEINTPTQYVGDNTEFLKIAYESLAGLLDACRRMAEAASAGGVAPALAAEVKDLIDDANLDYLTQQIPRAVEQSLEGVSRISSIVQAMKEFSHPGVTEKTFVDLNQCIRSTVTVSRNEWKYVADLETDLAPDLPQVSCLPGEFNQVILNMIVNAAHAIADVVGDGAERKGKITVSTRQDGAWVEVRVADSGAGIPEEIRDRIFDPFFTTKEVGRGTGQGLAIARNVIVAKHGGTISVRSEVGKGTTFTIRLPIGGDAREQDEQGITHW